MIQNETITITVTGANPQTLHMPLALNVASDGSATGTGTISYVGVKTGDDHVQAAASLAGKNLSSDSVLVQFYPGVGTSTTAYYRPSTYVYNGGSSAGVHNPSNAYDTNPSTYADLDSTIVTFSGFPAINGLTVLPTALKLIVISAPWDDNTNDGCDISYSLNAGTSWTTIYHYGVPASPVTRTDMVTLSPTQDLTKIWVKVNSNFGDAGTAHDYIYDINVQATYAYTPPAPSNSNFALTSSGYNTQQGSTVTLSLNVAGVKFSQYSYIGLLEGTAGAVNIYNGTSSYTFPDFLGQTISPPSALSAFSLSGDNASWQNRLNVAASSNYSFTNDFSNNQLQGWTGTLQAVTGQTFSKALVLTVRDTLVGSAGVTSCYPGQKFLVSGWLNASHLSVYNDGGNGTWTLALGLYFTDATNQFLPNNASWVTSSALRIQPGTGWTYVSDYVYAPAGAAHATPWIQINNGGPQYTIPSNLYGLVADLGWVSTAGFALSYNGAGFDQKVAKTNLVVSADDLAWYQGGQPDLFNLTSQGGGSTVNMEVNYLVNATVGSIVTSALVADGSVHSMSIVLSKPLPTQFQGDTVCTVTMTGCTVGTITPQISSGWLTGWNVNITVPLSISTVTSTLTITLRTGTNISYLTGTSFVTGPVTYSTSSSTVTIPASGTFPPAQVLFSVTNVDKSTNAQTSGVGATTTFIAKVSASANVFGNMTFWQLPVGSSTKTNLGVAPPTNITQTSNLWTATYTLTISTVNLLAQTAASVFGQMPTINKWNFGFSLTNTDGQSLTGGDGFNYTSLNYALSTYSSASLGIIITSSSPYGIQAGFGGTTATFTVLTTPPSTLYQVGSTFIVNGNSASTNNGKTGTISAIPLKATPTAPSAAFTVSGTWATGSGGVLTFTT